MKKFISSLLVAFSCYTFSTAHAAMVTDSFFATSAVGSGADHSLWISTGINDDIGSDFDFDPAGLFTLFDDGTATLTGTVISQDDNTSGFKLSFNYDNHFDFVPQFKSENGSVSTPDTFFRDLEGGSLIGFGQLDGLNLSVTRRPADGPYATQIGPGTDTNNGANNKNQNFGMAHWLTLIVEDKDCDICKYDDFRNLNHKQADINIDLAPVPLPATALFMISGVLGLLGFQRRKLQQA